MTPCVEVAMIIVSMNGGLYMEEAKAELGCPPLNDCYVANPTLFSSHGSTKDGAFSFGPHERTRGAATKLSKSVPDSLISHLSISFNL